MPGALFLMVFSLYKSIVRRQYAPKRSEGNPLVLYNRGCFIAKVGLMELIEIILFIFPAYIANSAPVIFSGGGPLDLSLNLPEARCSHTLSRITWRLSQRFRKSWKFPR